LVFLSNYGPQLLHLGLLKTDLCPSHPLRFSPPIRSASLVGYEPQVIHHRNRAFDAAAAGRLGRPTSADGGADSRSGQSLSFVPFPLAEGLPPQPCRPMSLRSPYPRSATRIARAMLQWRAARAGSWP